MDDKRTGWFALVLLTTTALIALTPITSSGGVLPPEASRVLDRFERSLRRHPRWLLKFEMDAIDERARARSVERTAPFRLQSVYYKDNDRIDVRTYRTERGKFVMASRSIVNGWFLSYELPPAGRAAASAIYASEGRKYLGAAMPRGLPAFEGFAASDYLSFIEILRGAAEVKVTHETIDSRECVLLQAFSVDYGVYRVWFDPETDFYPRKIVVEKLPGNLWSGRRLGDTTPFVPRGSRGPVSSSRVRFTMDAAKFDRVGDSWFPLECRVVRVHEFGDGNAETTTTECRRTLIDFNPDVDRAKAFVPDLRRDARLANQDDPQIPYVWDGGHPHPLVDPAVVGSMERAAADLNKVLAARKSIRQ